MLNNNNEQVQIFMLDNLDSFTYNLVDEFQCLGSDPTIYRNTLSADFIFEQIQNCTKQVLLVLSPGPGEPSKSGCLMALIAKCAGKYPILGICLGHQALVEHYGGKVERAPEIVHGKSSSITHRKFGVFEKNGFFGCHFFRVFCRSYSHGCSGKLFKIHLLFPGK